MNKQIDIINSIISDVKSYDDFKDVSFDNIDKIHITIIDNAIKWLGKVVPSRLNDNLVFELFIQNSVIDDLFSGDENKILFAKSIILHELYHIKELTLTNKIIDIMPIYSIKKDCTMSLLLNLGYMQWSEYYAHFNSAKHYHSSTNIADSIYQSEISLTALKHQLDNESQVIMPEFMYDNINDFISKTIKLAAIYNQTHDDHFLEPIHEYNHRKLYQYHYKYIYTIISYMDKFYQTYPSWISEKSFLEIGKKLFSIINDYDITYSTSDLSDNFIFKSSK